MDWLLSVPAAYRWASTLVFVALIVALSISPGVERPGDNMFVWLVVHTPATLQKIMHVGVYAVLAVLWMWTLESVESRTLRLALSLAATVGLGALLEWHQTRVPGRYGTIMDVLLNVAGAVLGTLAALLLL